MSEVVLESNITNVTGTTLFIINKNTANKALQVYIAGSFGVNATYDANGVMETYSGKEIFGSNYILITYTRKPRIPGYPLLFVIPFAAVTAVILVKKKLHPI
ncbi:MAG: hypothetical protein RBG13Loki_1873 [Promethearchaeota archaeon CR_4]|nr:MAG: hypothetical protein RBG13Loki_1873 [Candidatus Lokiarchaeota archaeon CR_4]